MIKYELTDDRKGMHKSLYISGNIDLAKVTITIDKEEVVISIAELLKVLESIAGMDTIKSYLGIEKPTITLKELNKELNRNDIVTPLKAKETVINNRDWTVEDSYTTIKET